MSTPPDRRVLFLLYKLLHQNEKPKTSGNRLCFRSLFIFNCQKQSLRTLDLAGAQASGANVYMTGSSFYNRFHTLYVRLPCSVRASVGVGNLDSESNTLSANFALCHRVTPPFYNRYIVNVKIIPQVKSKCKCFFKKNQKKPKFFILYRKSTKSLVFFY